MVKNWVLSFKIGKWQECLLPLLLFNILLETKKKEEWESGMEEIIAPIHRLHDHSLKKSQRIYKILKKLTSEFNKNTKSTHKNKPYFYIQHCIIRNWNMFQSYFIYFELINSH